MKDNTSSNSNNDRSNQDLNKNRSGEGSNQHQRQTVGREPGTSDLSGASNLDEKSSGMGRRDKGTGLATKDGLTGSDFDGQVG